MYPVALDLKRIPILLCGRGELVERRERQLREAGALQVVVKEIPTMDDVRASRLVLAAGLTREESEVVGKLARDAGRLINVEDVMELCDFYFTANVQRGDLIIAVSTSGASPTLARKVRDWIAQKFGEEWKDRVVELATLRKQWKDEGRDMKEVLAASEEHIAKKRWLP